MLTFRTLDEVIEFIGEAPPYDPRSPRWVDLPMARVISCMSESGFAKFRRRIDHRYESRDSKGKVRFYAPMLVQVIIANARLNGGGYA